MPFEIQIRTHEMHKIAQEGIAAHWKYKEGKAGTDAMDKELEWVRNLMETQADIMDPDVFMNSLKIDMFSDQVFAFTPQGKVIPLPNGSTAIDFAFAIHTQVGSKMIGAKASLSDIDVDEDKLSVLLEYSPLVRNRLTLMRLRKCIV
jgi:GTP pyrophosphokinase